MLSKIKVSLITKDEQNLEAPPAEQKESVLLIQLSTKETYHRLIDGFVRACLSVLLFLFSTVSSYAGITKENLGHFYQSIVSVHTSVLSNARTAASLGIKREGNGVAIDETHILTIGYIIIEADRIEIGLPDGRRFPATIVGYDHTSGFGIVKPVIPIKFNPLPLGDSDTIDSNEDLLILPAVERGAGSIVRSVSRRPFAGWWEYFLKSPIYTVPANGLWAGAPILNQHGEILGLGSLFVSEAIPSVSSPGNMSVPINILKPILQDLISHGRRKNKIQPYIGISSDDRNDQITVTGVSKGGPAFNAGIKPQDVVLTVNGSQVSNLTAFYQKIWNSGEAGEAIELTVLRDGAILKFNIISVDRMDYFVKPRSF